MGKINPLPICNNYMLMEEKSFMYSQHEWEVIFWTDLVNWTENSIF